MAVTLSAGQFSGFDISQVPAWYLSRLNGDTTNDGLTLSTLAQGDAARIQFELLCRTDPDWHGADLLRDSVLKFAGTTYTAKFGVNSEEISLAAATTAAAVSSSANLLPASSLILGVKAVCTQTFTVAGTVTGFAVGDTNLTSVLAKYIDYCTSVVVGDKTLRFLDWVTNATDDYVLDATNTSAGVIKVLVNGTTTLGKVKIYVLYATLS